jgi:GTP-binding protein
MDIRNIAIIAHVDHGKTTLIDQMLKQSGTFRENQKTEERMMDSMDLERERGITIAAKNASFQYRGTKVNIVDTPGHSDFGGEVERVLNMVDGAILLVDSSEGPLPQTRFVLSKALEQGIRVIVCINKIDRPDRRIDEVLDEVFSLFIDVSADDEDVDFDVLYAVGRDGYAVLDPNEDGRDLSVLFDWIVDRLPAPRVEPEKPFQMMVSNIDYNDFVGRLAIGRIQRGHVRVNDVVCIMDQYAKNRRIKVRALYSYNGMAQTQVEELHAGDIAVLAGVEDIEIGDTIADAENPEAIHRISVEEPTVGMMFSINNGPFSGREGKLVTSSKIAKRLQKELLHNVALRVEETNSAECWKVMGRGELQLAVLIETMRREGFELLVSKPEVIFKTENGQKLEPFENVIIDVPEEYVGVVTEKLGSRKGIMQDVQNLRGRNRLVFKIPSRGLIGYRSEFLTDTRGTGLMNTELLGYEPFAGEITQRHKGAMISDRLGKATAYALHSLEPRGKLFIKPQTEVYDGMVIGEHAKENDLNVNATKEKKLTNVRASGSDEAIKLTPVKNMSLEYAMDWISQHELIEVTPQNIRIRCKELNPHMRKRFIV